MDSTNAVLVVQTQQRGLKQRATAPERQLSSRTCWPATRRPDSWAFPKGRGPRAGAWKRSGTDGVRGWLYVSSSQSTDYRKLFYCTSDFPGSQASGQRFHRQALFAVP